MQEKDWTLDYEELLIGAALRFLKSKKKILVVGMDEHYDMRELFLDEELDENFFIDSYENDNYQAIAIFERNNKPIDIKNPRKCLNYIDSFSMLPLNR